MQSSVQTTGAGTLIIDARYAEGKLERLRALAGEIVSAKPDLIFAPAAPATAAVADNGLSGPTGRNRPRADIQGVG